MRDALQGVRAVSVAAGAVLRAEGPATISELEISSEGAGTIDGFAFAETGTLNLTGFASFGAIAVLPGTYANATGLANVENWSIDYGDGKAHRCKLHVVGDKLQLVPAGFLMIVQ